MILTRLLAAFLVLSHLTLSAYGWNAEGHMVVAQIAYNHLDPAVKSQCDALIAVPLTYSASKSSTFVTASCWADDFKSQLGTGTWHYIDLVFSIDGDNTPTNQVSIAPFDIVQALNQCIATLQNPSATQTDKATALRYILHFVGDIEQPLHCSTAVWMGNLGGDAGGNGFYINGTWSNLHSLWDSGGGFLTDSISRPLTAGGQTTINNKVATVEAAFPFVANPGTIPDPLDWAIEGRDIAKNVSYAGITLNSTPSSTYLNTAQATTEQRMAIGGKRLADLLNTLFAPPAPESIQLTCLVTNSNFQFTWNTVPGNTYRVQWKQDATELDWQDLATNVASSNSMTLTEPPSQSQRLYRVFR